MQLNPFITRSSCMLLCFIFAFLANLPLRAEYFTSKIFYFQIFIDTLTMLEMYNKTIKSQLEESALILELSALILEISALIWEPWSEIRHLWSEVVGHSWPIIVRLWWSIVVHWRSIAASRWSIVACRWRIATDRWTVVTTNGWCIAANWWSIVSVHGWSIIAANWWCIRTHWRWWSWFRSLKKCFSEKMNYPINGLLWKTKNSAAELFDFLRLSRFTTFVMWNKSLWSLHRDSPTDGVFLIPPLVGYFWD